MAGDFAVQFLAAHEGMVALERNLRSEHVLIHGFLSHFCTQARARRCRAARAAASAGPGRLCLPSAAPVTGEGVRHCVQRLRPGARIC